MFLFCIQGNENFKVRQNYENTIILMAVESRYKAWIVSYHITSSTWLLYEVAVDEVKPDQLHLIEIESE